MATKLIQFSDIEIKCRKCGRDYPISFLASTRAKAIAIAIDWQKRNVCSICAGTITKEKIAESRILQSTTPMMFRPISEKPNIEYHYDKNGIQKAEWLPKHESGYAKGLRLAQDYVSGRVTAQQMQEMRDKELSESAWQWFQLFTIAEPDLWRGRI